MHNAPFQATFLNAFFILVKRSALCMDWSKKLAEKGSLCMDFSFTSVHKYPFFTKMISDAPYPVAGTSIMASVRRTTHTAPNRAKSFAPNLSHVEYSTFASASPPIMAPLVGVNRFTKPLPALNTIIMTSTEKPSWSARGAMMGMETVAMPEDDGMRNESTT